MDEVREDKIVNNLGLVNKVLVDKIFFDNNNYDDLFQVGCIGLIKAVDLYDDSRNVKFSTFAYKLIYTEILSYLKLRQNKNYTVSLNTCSVNWLDNDDINLIDIVKDEKCNIEEDYIDLEEKIIINKLIKRVRLSDKCKFIVLLYYGFYNNRKYTKKQLASIFNVSSTYIGVVIDKFIKEMDKLIKIEYGRDITINRDKHKIYSRR